MSRRQLSSSGVERAGAGFTKGAVDAPPNLHNSTPLLAPDEDAVESFALAEGTDAEPSSGVSNAAAETAALLAKGRLASEVVSPSSAAALADEGDTAAPPRVLGASSSVSSALIEGPLRDDGAEPSIRALAGEGTQSNSLEQPDNPSPASSAGPEHTVGVTLVGRPDTEDSGPALEASGASAAAVEDTETASCAPDKVAVVLSGIPSAAAPALDAFASWTERGLQLRDQGLRLKALTDDWRWAVGDWLVEGERYGAEAEQFRDSLGVGWDAIRQYQWVARVVTPGNRIEGLSWSHHRAVGALAAADAQEARAALLAAKAEGITARELAASLKEPVERERHACPLCHYEHYAVVRDEWKG